MNVIIAYLSTLFNHNYINNQYSDKININNFLIINIDLISKKI